MSDERAPAQGHDLDEAHRQWLDERRAQARALLGKYAPARHDPPTLQDADEAFEGFRKAPPAGREPVKEALEALAVVVGDHLADIPGLAWIVVKDDEGSDPAIYGEAGELLIYPTTYVEARFEAGERLDAVTMVAGVEERWRSLLEAWDDD